MSEQPPKPEMIRSSSFARSFFQGGQNEGDGGGGGGGGGGDAPPAVAADHGGGDAESGAAAGPGGGSRGSGGSGSTGTGTGGGEMRRQRSRRKMSTRGSRSAGDTSMVQAAAAAAATVTSNPVHYDEGEPTQYDVPHVGDGNGNGNADGNAAMADAAADGSMPPPLSINEAGRQCSWYTDAVLQGGGKEDLSAILRTIEVSDDKAAAVAAVAVAVAAGGGHLQEEHQHHNHHTHTHHSDEDEVLEQYRIMAHVEANIRVMDNTGFDMTEYEKRRKLQPEPTKGDYYSGTHKPKAQLPKPRPCTGAGATRRSAPPQEPPLPPPRANRRFIQQRTPKVPELCPGVALRGAQAQAQAGVNATAGEHVVRCLGCKVKLRVNLLATLVDCPMCSTVSPASSTRR